MLNHDKYIVNYCKSYGHKFGGARWLCSHHPQPAKVYHTLTTKMYSLPAKVYHTLTIKT